MSHTPLWQDSALHSITRGGAECDSYWSFFALLASFPTTPGWLELCGRDPGSGRTIRFWTVPEEVGKIRRWLAERASCSQAFFGIAHRARASVGTPSLASLPALWANVNRASVHVPPEVPPPTAIVFTGRGHHLYWALREGVMLSPERVRTVDRVLRGLARWVQADPGSAEVSQLLRIPGTLNAKYHPPVCTAVILLEPTRRAPLEAFLPFAEPDDTVAESRPDSSSLDFQPPDDATDHAMMARAALLPRRDSA